LEINGIFGTSRFFRELSQNEAILVAINFGTTSILYGPEMEPHPRGRAQGEW